ncbi:hypothetical protein D3C76_1812010 [compost metagenome]
MRPLHAAIGREEYGFAMLYLVHGYSLEKSSFSSLIAPFVGRFDIITPYVRHGQVMREHLFRGGY